MDAEEMLKKCLEERRKRVRWAVARLFTLKAEEDGKIGKNYAIWFLVGIIKKHGVERDDEIINEQFELHSTDGR